MYNVSIYSILVASIPSCNSNCNSYVIPGFNDYVKECHTQANAYVIWRATGKPRDSYLRDEMCITRLHFKCAFRQCKLLDETARVDAMAKFLQNYDSTEFWDYVKASKKCSIPLATKVNTCVGEENSSSMWKNHVSNLLN